MQTNAGPHRFVRASDPVLVLGGGLAGIAAAVRLAQAGVPVTLVETRKRLGGRATSFVDPTTGQVLDNCQHVLLKCCTNLLDLYERLGVADRIEWHRKLYFRDGNGVTDVLESDDLPAPTHTFLALMRFRSLTWRDKLGISLGVAALMKLGKQGRAAWHDRSFADWLTAHHQTPGAIRKFWACVAISALNEVPERMAADYAIQVFQEGFCAHEDAYIMGLPAVPLVQLYDQVVEVIERAGHGGRVMLSTSVEGLRVEGRTVTAVDVAREGAIAVSQVISALPYDRLAKVCPPEVVAMDHRLTGLAQIDASPIIGVHLWMHRSDGRPIMDLPHLALTESPVHWIFRKADAEAAGQMQTDQGCEGEHLHAVISAAHEWVDLPPERVATLVEAEVRKALPGARDATLGHIRVVKEKRATFSIQPGVDRLRGSVRGGITNLYLAGDWCLSGWPATMEGAVRSGYLAAAAVLADRGLPATPEIVPDLPASLLYQCLSGN